MNNTIRKLDSKILKVKIAMCHNEFKSLDLQILHLEKAMSSIGELGDEGIPLGEWDELTRHALDTVRKSWTTLGNRREDMDF